MVHNLQMQLRDYSTQQVLTSNFWEVNSAKYIYISTQYLQALMKDLVEVIAKSLVDNPSEVHVNEIQGQQDLILELRVAPEDMGKVIGKQGRIAKAIRTVVKAAALNKDQKIVVEIIDVKSQDFS